MLDCPEWAAKSLGCLLEVMLIVRQCLPLGWKKIFDGNSRQWGYRPDFCPVGFVLSTLLDRPVIAIALDVDAVLGEVGDRHIDIARQAVDVGQQLGRRHRVE
jgi:hypothetical protein